MVCILVRVNWFSGLKPALPTYQILTLAKSISISDEVESFRMRLSGADIPLKATTRGV
jgi:hypothetical protein